MRTLGNLQKGGGGELRQEINRHVLRMFILVPDLDLEQVYSLHSVV